MKIKTLAFISLALSLLLPLVIFIPFWVCDFYLGKVDRTAIRYADYLGSFSTLASASIIALFIVLYSRDTERQAKEIESFKKTISNLSLVVKSFAIENDINTNDFIHCDKYFNKVDDLYEEVALFIDTKAFQKLP